MSVPSDSGNQPWYEPTSQPRSDRAGRPFYKKKRFIVPGVLVALFVVAGIAGGSKSGPSTPTTVTASTPSLSPTPDPSLEALRAQAQASKAAASASAAAVEASQSAAAAQASASAAAVEASRQASAAAVEASQSAAAAAAEAAAAAAEGTASQQNAYRSAKSYLEFQAFSRKGLLTQLTSTAGEGFPAADALFAIKRLEREGGVDWNEQAAKSAKSYLEFQAFSRAGLLEQLSSSAGEGFTPAQAAYGVKAAGL